MTQSVKNRTVLFDHDGGVDDLLSLMMLLAMPHINLIGVVVTPADCFLRPAVSATLKTLRFLNRLDIEVSEGTLHGVHPFPRAWRAHAYAIDALPILNQVVLGDDEADEVKPDPNAYLPDALKPGTLDVRGQAFRKQVISSIVATLDPIRGMSRPVEMQENLGIALDAELARGNVILSRAERIRIVEDALNEVRRRWGGEMPKLVAEPGHQFLARKLREADTPVTVLITGPVSNLAAALAAEPRLASKVEEVVWMGGALNVPGNVKDYEHDGSAEWNVYWDPPSAHTLWQFDVPITIFPLDATNHVDVSMQFLYRLAQQRDYPLSDLAGQCWALTVGVIPSYEYTYFMWDTLTTGYLGAPQHITLKDVRCEVIPNGPSAGRTKVVAEGGKLIKAADKVDVEQFHTYLLGLFRR